MRLVISGPWGPRRNRAMVSLILPRMSADLQERTLAEIMQTASDVMGAAGAQIIGGHTSMGAEFTIGFSVTGLADAAPITLGGAQAGDVLDPDQAHWHRRDRLPLRCK